MEEEIKQKSLSGAKEIAVKFAEMELTPLECVISAAIFINTCLSVYKRMNSTEDIESLKKAIFEIIEG